MVAVEGIERVRAERVSVGVAFRLADECANGRQ